MIVEVGLPSKTIHIAILVCGREGGIGKGEGEKAGGPCSHRGRLY